MKRKIVELENKIYPIPMLIKDLGTRLPTIHSKEKKRYGLYKCPYCGNEWEAITTRIVNRKTKSCGCFQKVTKSYKKTHNLSTSKLYRVWQEMRYRCYNENNKGYVNYGGRGIQVYEAWKIDFKSFYDWAIKNNYQDGLSLDRINVNGNYEPDNCRWTTRVIQGQNTRDKQINNTSGYRGVSWHKGKNKYQVNISVCGKNKYLGLYDSIIEAAKVYESYIRLNNLEHNFTPILSDVEIKELNKEN